MSDLETKLAELSKQIKDERTRAKLWACMDLLLALRITATYGQIGRAVGLFAGSAYLARLLGERMREDHEAGRPLSCALVVGQDTGVPGEGFFSLAADLGYAIDGRDAFWTQQRDACFAAK